VFLRNAPHKLFTAGTTDIIVGTLNGSDAIIDNEIGWRGEYSPGGLCSTSPCIITVHHMPYAIRHHHTRMHAYTHTPTHTRTLTHSYLHTLIPSHTRTLTHSYPHTLVPSHTHTLTHSYPHTLIHSHTRRS
jgi:hypothetical protein